ncbi:MAG: ABC transporter permease [Acidobacteria bacterium]|nr:ABC transporter permease [Acidobacteriota bacterium]
MPEASSLHCRVQIGEAEIEKERQGTRRLGKGLLEFLREPWRTILRHRSLMISLVRRDILGRYRGSLGGALWTVAHPLLLMGVYFFVFGVVLGARFKAGQGPGEYIAYFFCGMLPWLAFSEAVGRAASVIWDHSGFVKRIIFPLEILPANLTLAGLVTEAFGLAILLSALLAWGAGLPWTAAYFPLILIPQILFTAGLCWLLAALGVFLRDAGQITGFLLTIWFFLTPICYSESALPQRWLWLLEKNPFYTIVRSYRAVLLENAAPAVEPLVVLWAVSLVIFWLGYAWFAKMKKSFADFIA